MPRPAPVSCGIKRAVAAAVDAAEQLVANPADNRKVHRTAMRAYSIWVRVARREVARATGEECPTMDACVLV